MNSPSRSRHKNVSLPRSPWAGDFALPPSLSLSVSVSQGVGPVQECERTDREGVQGERSPVPASVHVQVWFTVGRQPQSSSQQGLRNLQLCTLAAAAGLIGQRNETPLSNI